VRNATTFFFSAIAALGLLVSGCGGNSHTSRRGSNATGPTVTVDPATAGSISGTVKLDGKPPALRAINMSAEPVCEKAHPGPVMSEEVVTGEGGALGNVVVYVKGQSLDQYRYPMPNQPVVLDQQGCMYEPHVVALRTGQQLEVKNEDQTTHNVHALPNTNAEWNESQPPGAGPIEKMFAQPEMAIPIRCNVHPWMKAYVFVFANPYFTVTAKDGKFQIGNLPPGTYTVEAWQEHYGTLDQTVTIGAKESKQVSFVFKASSDSE
jgi:plastocyanin